MPTFQFSVTWVFCFTTMVAICCFLARQESAAASWAIVPDSFWTIVPAIFLIGAFLVARWPESAELAWEFICIGWVVALAGATLLIMDSFKCMGPYLRIDEFQFGLRLAFESTLILPCFLSVPAIYMVVRASRNSDSSGRKWLLICPVVGFVDVTLLTVWLYLFMGYTGPW